MKERIKDLKGSGRLLHVPSEASVMIASASAIANSGVVLALILVAVIVLALVILAE